MSTKKTAKKQTTNTANVNVAAILKEAQTFEPRQNARGKKSALEPFAEVIRVLKEEKKAPYTQIQEFLSAKGVESSVPNLRQFVAKKYPHLVNPRKAK